MTTTFSRVCSNPVCRTIWMFMRPGTEPQNCQRCGSAFKKAVRIGVDPANLHHLKRRRKEPHMDQNIRRQLKFAVKTTLLASGCLVPAGNAWKFNFTAPAIGSGTQYNLDSAELDVVRGVTGISNQTYPTIDAAVDYYLTVIDKGLARVAAA